MVFVFVIIGFVIIPYSHASCAAPLLGSPGPCFDSFSVSAGPPLTEKSIMENYARNIESNYGSWQISDRNWDDESTGLQLPAIICTEFVTDGVNQYRMAKWVDSQTISSFENHRDDSLCDKWLSPIDDDVKITWDQPDYLSNDIGIVKVIDKDMNLDNKKTDSFDIHVWSDTDHSGIELTITEIDNASGIFGAKVFFTTQNKSRDTILLVEDAVYAEHKSNVGSARIINESEYIDGDSIDSNPDLSPSYTRDFVFGWKSIFVFVPLISGIIITILLSIHFILKKKHIRSRPYITIISAVIMLYFGIKILSMSGTIVMFLQQESPWHYLDQIVTLLAYPIIGVSLTGLGIIFLYKSQLVRNLIRK